MILCESRYPFRARDDAGRFVSQDVAESECLATRHHFSFRTADLEALRDHAGSVGATAYWIPPDVWVCNVCGCAVPALCADNPAQADAYARRPLFPFTSLIPRLSP